MKTTPEKNSTDTVQSNSAAIEHDEKHKTITELFDGYDGNYEPIEINRGEPVGRDSIPNIV